MCVNLTWLKEGPQVPKEDFWNLGTGSPSIIKEGGLKHPNTAGATLGVSSNILDREYFILLYQEAHYLTVSLPHC